MAAREDIDIEKLLIWTYQTKAADKVVGRQMSGLGPGPVVTNAQGLMRMGALGCRIDQAGRGTHRASVHDLDPDAEAVHEALMRLGIEAGSLVLQCARTSSRPDWMPGIVSQMRPVMRGNGRPKMVYHDAACSRPSYCLVEAEPPQSRIDFARGVYRRWWDALASLVDVLVLRRFVATGPAMPREPWRSEPLTNQMKVDYRSPR